MFKSISLETFYAVIDEKYFFKGFFETYDLAEQWIKMNTKPTNPKDSVGIKKVPLSTVPAPVMMEVGLAMLEGARKYGRHNYREAGVRASVYYDALMRHMMDWWEGEDIDPDSGLSHVTKAIATLTVLRDSMIRRNWEDDRPLRVSSGWLQELNKKAGEIIEKYPDPKPAFTQKNQTVPSEMPLTTNPNGNHTSNLKILTGTKHSYGS